MRTVSAKVLAVLVLAGSVLAGSVAATSADQAGVRAPLRLAPCRVVDIAALCGSLSVPENRAADTGRTISLRIAVVPARDAPRPDPVVWLAGGPGVAATDDLPGAAQFLWTVNRDRDLVFVDQRGTGGSNRLVCPQGPDGDGRAGLRACLAGLAADPAAAPRWSWCS